jgi:hypothetical protein
MIAYMVDEAAPRYDLRHCFTHWLGPGSIRELQW